MRKLAAFLCAMLLLATLPFYAFAAEQEDVRTQIAEDYKKIYGKIGKENLSGYCGLLASWQLYYRGINTSPIPKDGNKQFDTYCNMTVTSGGYRIRAYGAKNYSLQSAIDAITDGGTKNVRNILVSFEWTNTPSGAFYGHTVFVYAISEGKAYFTESFATSFGTYPGKPICVSISEFVDYYDDWTKFDGIIVFDKEQDYGVTLPANLYVQAESNVKIMTEPCEENADCVLMRIAGKGERLRATELILTKQGQYYYRVSDCNGMGFIPAQQVTPIRYCYEDIEIGDLKTQSTVKTGGDFSLEGTFQAPNGAITELHMDLRTTDNRFVAREDVDHSDGIRIRAENLPQGSYICRIYGTFVCYLPVNGTVQRSCQNILLTQQAFGVGQKAEADQRSAGIRNGWLYENGKWYLYKNAEPVSGWYGENGIRYYLKDGCALTGWTVIDGEQRLFTKTGAMCTGWLYRNGGKSYIYAGGRSARGITMIDGKYYGFDEKGLLMRNRWYEQNGKKYYLQSDGTAAVNILILPEGMFMFNAKGCLLAEVQGNNDSSIAKNITGNNN